MAQSQFARDFSTGSRETYFAAGGNANESVFLEAPQGHRHRGRRDFQQMRQACGDYRFAFGLSFEDGLEVVLLGDGDHLWGLYDGGLIVVNADAERTLPSAAFGPDFDLVSDLCGAVV